MFKLNQIQKNKLKKITKKYGLNFILLFGSRASGKTHKKSDFDFAYSAKKSLGYEKEHELIRDLRRLFTINLKIRVDLVNLRQAPPLLAKEIAFKGKLLSEITPHSFASFQIYAFKLYIEAKPLFALQNKFIEQNL